MLQTETSESYRAGQKHAGFGTWGHVLVLSSLWDGAVIIRREEMDMSQSCLLEVSQMPSACCAILHAITTSLADFTMNATAVR